VIAAMDAVNNDAPPTINAYPSFYLKKRDNKKHEIDPNMMYDGDRSKEAFIGYLKQHSRYT